jgi:hypothetical protein
VIADCSELWWKDSNLHPLGNNQTRYRYATPQLSSVQGDLNPRIRHGKAAGCHYIMDAPSNSAPAAGVEPAAFCASGRRSYRLSYAGETGPAVGLEPTRTALRVRRSATRTPPASVPEPGFEPGTQASRACMISISPLRHSVPRPGVEPGLRRSKRRVLSVTPAGHSQTSVPGVGVEPTSPGSEPGVLPVRRPRNTLGGIRTRVLRIESPAATPQAPRGQIPGLCRAGVEPAQKYGWVTATWARQCPADTFA